MTTLPPEITNPPVKPLLPASVMVLGPALNNPPGPLIGPLKTMLLSPAIPALPASVTGPATVTVSLNCSLLGQCARSIAAESTEREGFRPR